MKRTVSLFVLWVSALILLLSDVHAMPAFARKYQMSCKVCHSPFPRLKEFGDTFAANGFVLPDKDTPRYFVDTGDDKVSLLRDLPVAIRFEGFASYNHSDSRQVDFSAPYLVKLLSGGAITKHVSYYLYFFFGEKGKVAGLEDAFLMFNDILGDLDIYVGQFQASDPLFKRELRLTFEGYRIYETKVGLSNIDLTYDRGIMFTYGLKSGTDVVLEILNGSGIGDADSTPFGTFDTDRYKNLLGRVSQDIGKNFRVGAVGYTGKEEQRGAVNSLRMLGIDGTAEAGPFQLNLQYLERRDQNPGFTMSGGSIGVHEIKTRGGLAELIYTPHGDDSKWYGVGMFNWVDSGLKELQYGSATLHFGYMLRRNIRLVWEFNQCFRSPDGKYAKFSVGMVSAF